MENNDSSNDNEETYGIDDDSVRVNYHGNWDLTLDPSSTVGDKTSHSTSDPNASLFLSFRGTQIKVFGDIPAGEGVLSTNYTIDNGEPVNKVEPGLTQNMTSPDNMLFQSDILPMGHHNLTINVVKVSDNRSYSLSQFDVTTTRSTGATTSSAVDKGGKDVAAIIGGILGAVIFLLLLALGTLYIWQQRRLTRLLRDAPFRNSWNPKKSSLESVKTNLEPGPLILPPLREERELPTTPMSAEERAPEPPVSRGPFVLAETTSYSSVGTERGSFVNSAIMSISETVVSGSNGASRTYNLNGDDGMLRKYR